LVNLEKNYIYIIIHLNDNEKGKMKTNREYFLFSTADNDFMSLIYKIKNTYNFSIDLINTVNYLYVDSINFFFREIVDKVYTHLSNFPYEIIDMIKDNNISLNDKITNIYVNINCNKYENRICDTNINHTEISDSNSEKTKVNKLKINNTFNDNIFNNVEKNNSNKLNNINKNYLDDIKPEESTNENNDNLENNEDYTINFNEYIFQNIDNIIKIALSYDYLFEHEEKEIIKRYQNNLDNLDKQVFLKFLLSGNLWLKIDKFKFKENLEIKQDEIEKIISKLINLNLLKSPFFFIFKKSFQNISYINPVDNKEIFNRKELINFLHYLKNDEIKYILNELKKLTKNIPNLSSNDYRCEDIFANNPFFRSDKYVDFDILKFQIKNIQKLISEFIFKSDKFQNKESKFKHSFLYNPVSFNQKNLNSINSANYKKTKIIKFTDCPKVQNIFLIIKIIENYLNDKSSNMLNNFLNIGKKNSSSQTNENINDNNNNNTHNQKVFLENKILNGKIIHIKKIFERFNSQYYSLDLNFAKIFDNATQLFFFYSEYNDINDLAKEYYQFENFEKYENYIFDKQILGKDSEYLKPIFTNKIQFKLFDNLNYIKKQFSIQYMLANDHYLNFNLMKNLLFTLLEIINPVLFKELFQDNLFYKDEKSFDIKDIDNHKMEIIKIQYEKFHTKINDKNLHKRLIDILLKFDFMNIDDSFLSKYNPAYNACYILNYFAEQTEKQKEYNLASFIYNYLLISNYLGKKRGFWWFRLILIYKNYLTNNVKKNSLSVTANDQNSNNILDYFSSENNLNTLNKNICLKLLKKSSEDKFIKSGYYEKIKSYYENIEKANNKIANKDKLNNKKNKKTKNKESTAEKIDKVETNELLDEIKKKFKSIDIDESNFNYTEITADSVFNKLTGKRMYSYNNNLSTVEQFALNHYNNLGYNGVHGENKILPCLYNLFFWDLIYYDKIPYVFQSSYQSYPLDFFSPDFYFNRENLIKNRIIEIEKFNDSDIKGYIESIFDKKKNIKTPLIDWKYYMNGKDILVKIAISITGKKLSKIFEEFAMNIRYIIKGMPDLFLWNEKSLSGSALLVEVKSINDKLSDHQKYWLKFLKNNFIETQILHIK